MSWSSALLTALLYAASQTSELLVSYWILLAGMPATACTVGGLWLGESMRVGRAGRYLTAVEDAIEHVLFLASEGGSDDSTRALKKLLMMDWKAQGKMSASLSWERSLRSREGGGDTLQMRLPYYIQAGFFAAAAIVPIVAAAVLAGRGRWTTVMVVTVPWAVIVLVTGYFGVLFAYARRIP